MVPGPPADSLGKVVNETREGTEASLKAVGAGGGFVFSFSPLILIVMVNRLTGAAALERSAFTQSRIGGGA